MKKRWSANTWVVVILFALIGLISIDIGRNLLRGDRGPTDEPVKPPSMDPKFKVGEKAPDFTLPDKKGNKHSLSKLVKGDTMLWFTCGCSSCLEMQTYMTKLTKQLGSKAPAVINVTTMLPDREETWFRDTKLKQTILYEGKEGGPLGEIYHGHPCPRFFRLKPDRTVTMIGKSPATMPDMNVIGADLAHNLGFQLKGEKLGAGKPIAPAPNFPLPGVGKQPTQAAAAGEPASHEGHSH